MMWGMLIARHSGQYLKRLLVYRLLITEINTIRKRLWHDQLNSIWNWPQTEASVPFSFRPVPCLTILCYLCTPDRI